uniref:Exonuclease domain-containing protein n=1 Tax=Rhabditophanes sp. KR3021 TaxID=114890 RepID=A0AC35TKB9_9BILA
MITGLTKLYQWTRGLKTVAVQNLTPFDPASYIFLDFETTGLIPSGLIPYITSLKGKNPGKTLEDLLKLNVDSVSRDSTSDESIYDEEKIASFEEHPMNVSVKETEYVRHLIVDEIELQKDPKTIVASKIEMIKETLLFGDSDEEVKKVPIVDGPPCKKNLECGKKEVTEKMYKSDNNLSLDCNIVPDDKIILLTNKSIESINEDEITVQNVSTQINDGRPKKRRTIRQAIDRIEGTFLSEITRIITSTKSEDPTLDKMSQELVNIYLNEVKSKSLTQRYPSCFVESPEQNYLLPPYKPPKQKVNQKLLYDTIIGGHFDAHRASADTEAILKICMAYGKDFVKYVDNNCFGCYNCISDSRHIDPLLRRIIGSQRDVFHWPPDSSSKVCHAEIVRQKVLGHGNVDVNSQLCSPGRNSCITLSANKDLNFTVRGCVDLVLRNSISTHIKLKKDGCYLIRSKPLFHGEATVSYIACICSSEYCNHESQYSPIDESTISKDSDDNVFELVPATPNSVTSFDVEARTNPIIIKNEAYQNNRRLVPKKDRSNITVLSAVYGTISTLGQKANITRPNDCNINKNIWALIFILILYLFK